MNADDDVICYLNMLTQILITQKHVYSKFSKTVNDPVLALFFKTKAKDIRGNIYELRKVVFCLGGNPVYKSSFIRILLRKWAETKILVMSNDHFQLLVQLHNEEEAILKAYKDFNWMNLPKDLRCMIVRHMSDVRRNISQIKRLHNHMNLVVVI